MNKKGVSKKNKSGRFKKAQTVIFNSCIRDASALVKKIARCNKISRITGSVTFNLTTGKPDNTKQIHLSTEMIFFGCIYNNKYAINIEEHFDFNIMVSSNIFKNNGLIHFDFKPILSGSFDGKLKVFGDPFDGEDVSGLDLSNMTEEKKFQLSTVIADLDELLELNEIYDKLVEGLKNGFTMNSIINSLK